MSTAADWLLATLADARVEVMFGNPGSTELPLMDAFPRQKRVRYVLGLHEASVMGMADGYAQHGRRLAVVNVHVQPGLANALSGVLNAARARVPMLVTVGQQVTGLKDQAPFLGGELVELARPIAKEAVEVGSVEELPDVIARAICRRTYGAVRSRCRLSPHGRAHVHCASWDDGCGCAGCAAGRRRCAGRRGASGPGERPGNPRR